MVIKSENRSRAFDENTSVRAKMLKTESAMTDVVSTLILRYQKSIEKRQEVPVNCGSIWDYSTENTLEVNKTFRSIPVFENDSEIPCRGVDTDTRAVSRVMVKPAEEYAYSNSWTNPRNESVLKNKHVPSQSIFENEYDNLDELFPDLKSNGQNVRKAPKKFYTTELNRNLAPNKPQPCKDESPMEISNVSKLKSSEVFRKVNKVSETPSNPSLVNATASTFERNSKSVGAWKSKIVSMYKASLSDCSRNELGDLSHSPTGKNVSFEPSEISKSVSSPKSTNAKKSFKEWSCERFLAKNSPPKYLPCAIKLPKDPHLETLVTVKTSEKETIASSVKSDPRKLREVETDYFFGVRSDFDMNYLDFESGLLENVDGIKTFKSSEGCTQLVAQKQEKNSSIKESCEDGVRLCPVSEYLDPLWDVPELKAHNGYGTKRKSTATHSPLKSNSRRRHNSKQSSPNRSRYSKDCLSTSEEMVNLQVADQKGEKQRELLVLGMEIFEIKESFPLIYNVLPAVDLEDITLPFSACAMTIVLKSVFQATYTIPSWDVAVEVYAIAKEYRVQNLVNSCKIYFNANPIAIENILQIAELAKHFRVEEVLQQAKTFRTSERPILNSNTWDYETQSCIISSCMYKEPMEFSIPLCYSKGDLGSIKKSDFRNELEIESLQGVHTVTGVQIKLEVDSSEKGKEVQIYCEVFKGNERVLDVEVEAKLRNITAVNFNKTIRLRPKEAVKVAILIEDIKLSWCHCLKEEKMEHRNANGMLHVRFKSHNKTSTKQALFFIDKVFYTN